MKLNRWRPEQQRAHGYRPYHGVPRRWLLKKNHGGRKHNFSTSSTGQARREPSDRPKTEEKLKTSIAASPSLCRAWRLRVSSAHSREAESDSFLARAAKKNRGCRRRARDGARCRSHLPSSVIVSRVFSEMLLFSHLNTFESNTCVLDRTQSRIFPPNRIEFKSIHKKKSI